MRDGLGRRFPEREGTSGGMSGGVGARVGGGVAMLLELSGEGEGEGCLRQPRMRVRNNCRGCSAVKRRGKEKVAESS